jgi:fructokinase
LTLYGGIEAGGTKWICAVGHGCDIVAEEEFATSSPEATINRALAFFRSQGKVEAIGIASFGPIDLHADSPHYGKITTTPKPGWAYTDVVGPFARAFSVPVQFDTDVNVAAFGEYMWGAGRGLETFIYLTIGTGIGGGGLVNGKLMHGLIHPEMGHIVLPHDREIDPYEGSCPYHADCLEGLACGVAIERRWGMRGNALPADHQGWELEAHYLALGLVTFICTLSPQRIILGGGVMRQQQLFPLIRRKVRERLNHYVQAPAIIDEIEQYIVPPDLGGRAGVIGALALAGHRSSHE